MSSPDDAAELCTDTPIRDWEVSLWGVSEPPDYHLAVRGNHVGYVRVVSSADAPVELCVCLFADAQNPAGIEASRNRAVEDAVLRGVRKGFFGPENWPKHVVELSYRTRRLGY